MNISDVIRATKTNVELGPWKNGHIPRSTFPLSLVKSKSYKLGPQYRWRVIKFKIEQERFRLLIVLNEEKQIYRATLGVERNQDLAVICQHEYHAGEPGWHCHLTSSTLSNCQPGMARKRMARWPKSTEACSRKDFQVDSSNAVTIAATRFGFQAQGDLI